MASTNIPNSARISINPQPIGARQAAEQNGVDPATIEKAMNQYKIGSDLLQSLGEAVNNYFKAIHNSYVQLTDRMPEAQIKAQSATPPPLPKFQGPEFQERCTATLPLFEGRLPSDLFNHPEKYMQISPEYKYHLQVLSGVIEPKTAPLETLSKLSTPLKTDPSEKKQGGSSAGDGEGGKREQEEWDVVEQTEGLTGKRRALGPSVQALTTSPGQQQAPTPAPGTSAGANRQVSPGLATTARALTTSPAQSPQNGPATNPVYTQREREMLDAIIPKDDPFYGAVSYLIDNDELFRQVMAENLNEEQRAKKLRELIISQLEKLDPTKPEDMKKIQILQFELAQSQEDSRTRMNNLTQAQRINQVLHEEMKKFLDTIHGILVAIARNIGSKG